MITIQSAESALKNIYLDSIRNNINTKTNPLLAMLMADSKTAYCKDARLGDIARPLEDLYGSFEISDKALRVAQNNASAFANLLSSEVSRMESGIQSSLNAKFYGWLKELAVEINFDEIDSVEFDEFIAEKGIDFILVDSSAKRKFLDNLKPWHHTVVSVEIIGGFRTIAIDEIPVYTDFAIKEHIGENTVFFINSTKLQLQQLCDWFWLTNDNGEILRRVDGKASYTATLVKYANLIAQDGIYHFVFDGGDK